MTNQKPTPKPPAEQDTWVPVSDLVKRIVAGWK